MSLSTNAVVTKSESAEVLAFRTETRSVVVGDSGTTLSSSVTGLRGGAVQVSGYSLELYLNACSPTCHG
ncbi:hypothetical protein [Cryobacterium sp. GrIS_2_6]|uniref:hypothetical protein n=1 Tax=Cryobacterium sp. GrIS_2_6 TaxID=3162785 RepID=UPI002E001664|nr:hypothetical protein [Cryobacterium psychrotolerans]